MSEAPEIIELNEKEVKPIRLAEGAQSPESLSMHKSDESIESIDPGADLSQYEVLSARLDTLEESGAIRFDSAAVTYSRELLKRSAVCKPGVAAILLEKVVRSIDRLDLEFAKAKKLSKSLLESVPGADAEQAKSLWLRGNFKAVVRWQRQVKSNQDLALKNQSALGQLIDYLVAHDPDAIKTEKQQSVDDFLREQEWEVLQALQESMQSNSEEQASARLLSTDDPELPEKDEQPVAKRPERAQPIAPPIRELKSARLYRDSLVKQSADKRVVRAIKEGPENPGPINSHGLTIKSLEMMRELSPKYLNRTVAYFDNLLWLKSVADIGEEEKRAKMAGQSGKKADKRKTVSKKKAAPQKKRKSK